MDLSTVFQRVPGDIVAFVGGGGKTTAMFRLAGEIARSGRRVITTTTTRIFAAQTGLAPNHFILQSPADLTPIRKALDTQPHVLVTGPVDHQLGKAFGVDPAYVLTLAQLPGVEAVLVEADGSRMRPFKAPAKHEPVIPEGTSLVVPVVGADVFGAPLTDTRVHRPERVSALTGAPLGTPLTPALVAQVLVHPLGGFKQVPETARVVVLVNKVETEADWQAARAFAAEPGVWASAVDRVALGALRIPDPIQEVHGRVPAVVLAAGQSTRMGRPKQILPWGGATLVQTVVQQLRTAGVQEVVVVTGAAREAVEAALVGSGARCVHNPDFASSEMARSLQVGLEALPPQSAAAVVALADQPQLDPGVVQTLVQRWRETQAEVVAPVYQGRRGNPVLFDRTFWPALRRLPPTANPRAALPEAARAVWVEVESPSIHLDLDTPEDYERGYNLNHDRK